MRAVEEGKGQQADLVCDVLLLHRSVALGVDEGWMCHQVPPVLHDEAPAPKTQQDSPVRPPWASGERGEIKHGPKELVKISIQQGHGTNSLQNVLKECVGYFPEAFPSVTAPESWGQQGVENRAD